MFSNQTGLRVGTSVAGDHPSSMRSRAATPQMQLRSSKRLTRIVFLVPVVVFLAIVLNAWGLSLISPSPTVHAQRSRQAQSSTVYIRVLGSLNLEVMDTWSREVETSEVEIGTGSGFVFTPYGHVLTNHHVVDDEQFEEMIDGRQVKGELSVSQIQVVVPSSEGGASGFVALPATVEVFDPDLDLAVLAVSGASFPYLALGDSDASQPGQSVTAFGFPFGRKVEIGLTSLPDIAPTVSVSSGSVAAMRQDASGNASYLQVNATVNPGNSGGPVVDEEGFVLGVMRLKLTGTEGIGFAIPVNAVKDFLEFNGYADLLPTRTHRLGNVERLDDKRLDIGLLEGLEDGAASRLQVYAQSEDGTLALAIDRVATPLSVEQLEQELMGSARLAPFTASGRVRGSRVVGGTLFGFGSGTYAGSSREAKLEYVIVSNEGRPEEKLIARFLGTAEAIAFNQSAIRSSLASLRADSMLSAPFDGPLAPAQWEWGFSRARGSAAPSIMFPVDWLMEESPALACEAEPIPEAALSALAPGDFRVSLRTSYWVRPYETLAEALGSCLDPSRATGATGASSSARVSREYSRAYEWLGTEYRVRGVLHPYGDGTLKREIVAPAESFAQVEIIFNEWDARTR